MGDTGARDGKRSLARWYVAAGGLHEAFLWERVGESDVFVLENPLAELI